jgi:hypothetical protein
MATLPAKIIALIALLLLPFAMSAAPAAAHHSSKVSMPMQHCPDDRGHADSNRGVPECAMACSAALPAAYGPHVRATPIARAPFEGARTRDLTGIHPETATPPPRRS